MPRSSACQWNCAWNSWSLSVPICRIRNGNLCTTWSRKSIAFFLRTTTVETQGWDPRRVVNCGVLVPSLLATVATGQVEELDVDLDVVPRDGLLVATDDASDRTGVFRCRRPTPWRFSRGKSLRRCRLPRRGERRRACTESLARTGSWSPPGRTDRGSYLSGELVVFRGRTPASAVHDGLQPTPENAWHPAAITTMYAGEVTPPDTDFACPPASGSEVSRHHVSLTAPSDRSGSRRRRNAPPAERLPPHLLANCQLSIMSHTYFAAPILFTTARASTSSS